MITGYNTDIQYKEKVFHVQTEDRGVKNPVIETVVYYGGQVLAARRSDYADLLGQGGGPEDISGRMDHQHRMMVAAIRAGKLDGKMKELLGPSFGVAEEKATPQAESPSLLEQARDDSGPTLDQVILDYLTTEAQQDQLELELAEGTELQQGESCALVLRATSAKTGLPVSGAQVAVRMISTVRDPQLLGEGTTDEDGGLNLQLSIPLLERGVGAVIISASSLIGSAELKQLL